MKTLQFHKMEGAGNDFVIIDNREYQFTMDEIIQFTPKLCDRKFGIGGDGILVLNSAEIADVDYTMIYRNADGSDAGMCGNGARCLALFASKNGFSASHCFNVHKNIYQAGVEQDGSVNIHFPVKVTPSQLRLNDFDLLKVDAATEHLVTFVEQNSLSNEDDLIKNGSELRYHQQMNPPGTNVNFVHIEGHDSISLQTYERGVENLTLACGTGALAAAIATHSSQEKQTSHSTYTVKVKGGILQASFNFDPETNTYHHLILNGPAHFVFKGYIDI